uniref:Sterile alpha and TIR motif-containing protein 1 n=1 Tax=Syphacia muris TaxID=451379 RepID=A0A0N5AYZ1_9BILA
MRTLAILLKKTVSQPSEYKGFDYNYQSGTQTLFEPPLQSEQKQQKVSLKTPSGHITPSSLRCRLLSAESSHSSDDSPQIDESGDKMLLKDVRNKSTYSISSKKKKLAHMEHYIADRGFRSEVLSYDEVGSIRSSPTLKKHSKKHSGQSGFKRSGLGKLDASSFVNTSFQAEDWDSRPVSPKRQVLPQVT